MWGINRRLARRSGGGSHAGLRPDRADLAAGYGQVNRGLEVTPMSDGALRRGRRGLGPAVSGRRRGATTAADGLVKRVRWSGCCRREAPARRRPRLWAARRGEPRV